MPKIRKHSISIKGHRTSFSLEDIFYDALVDIADERQMPLAKLIVEIDAENTNQGGLSSAIRVYVFKTLQQQMGREQTKIATEEIE